MKQFEIVKDGYSPLKVDQRLAEYAELLLAKDQEIDKLKAQLKQILPVLEKINAQKRKIEFDFAEAEKQTERLKKKADQQYAADIANLKLFQEKWRDYARKAVQQLAPEEYKRVVKVDGKLQEILNSCEKYFSDKEYRQPDKLLSGETFKPLRKIERFLNTFGTAAPAVYEEQEDYLPLLETKVPGATARNTVEETEENNAPLQADGSEQSVTPHGETPASAEEEQSSEAQENGVSGGNDTVEDTYAGEGVDAFAQENIPADGVIITPYSGSYAQESGHVSDYSAQPQDDAVASEEIPANSGAASTAAEYDANAQDAEGYIQPADEDISAAAQEYCGESASGEYENISSDSEYNANEEAAGETVGDMQSASEENSSSGEDVFENSEPITQDEILNVDESLEDLCMELGFMEDGKRSRRKSKRRKE